MNYTIECCDLNTGKNDTVFYSGKGFENSSWQEIKGGMYDHDRQEALLIETLETVIGNLAWQYELDLRNDSNLYHNVPMKDIFNKEFMENYIKENYNY